MQGYFLGIKTNNEAEYLALLLGLFLFKKQGPLVIMSDSELLVRQISGIYKVKSPNLIKLHELALEMLKELDYKIYHIDRSKNKEADKLANQGIERKIKIPDEFTKFLQAYYSL